MDAVMKQRHGINQSAWGVEARLLDISAELYQPLNNLRISHIHGDL